MKKIYYFKFNDSLNHHSFKNIRERRRFQGCSLPG